MIKNWRPITLLNVDYKIIVKAFASRINSVSNYIIDIIDYVEKENISALYISIDFEKCFDTNEYNAIEGTMLFFNFGDFMIKMFRTLYCEFQTCTCNNGNTSQWFPTT